MTGGHELKSQQQSCVGLAHITAHDDGVAPIAHPARSAPSQNVGIQLYSKTCMTGFIFV